MRELDLHGLSADDSLRAFIEFYNNVVRSHAREPIRVIHGYGSSGQGGRIRKRIREFLTAAGDAVDWKTGEDVEGNSGVTIVYPLGVLHAREDQLAAAILEFCSTPRSESKIAGQFRNYNSREIKHAIRALLRRDELKEVVKPGRTVCYCRRDL